MARSRRILVSLESRATYGYSRNVMRAMRDISELECRTLAPSSLTTGDGFPSRN